MLNCAPQELQNIGRRRNTGRRLVACLFFVQRPFRNKGVSGQLLLASVDYARDHGAYHVEAYPVAPDSETYRFMGLVPAFDEAGFRFVKEAGVRRKVMVLSLNENA